MAPLRFAQALGALFGLVGSIAFAADAPAAGLAAAAFALAAAFLNAAFGICLGCELFIVVRRFAGRGAISRFVPAHLNVEGNSA